MRRTRLTAVALVALLTTTAPILAQTKKAPLGLYEELADSIQNADTSKKENLDEVVRVSRGMYYDPRTRQLDRTQRESLKAIAVEKVKEWEAEYVAAKKAELDALDSTPASLGKVSEISGERNFFSAGLPLSPTGAKEILDKAQAKRKQIVEAIAQPVVDKANALPSDISSVPEFDNLLKQLPDDYASAQQYGTVRKGISSKRNSIVTAHRQKLCDAALDDLDVKPEVATLQIFPQISLRDFVCEAAKNGVSISYSEGGMWPISSGTPSLKIELSDPKTTVASDAIKQGQPVTVDLTKTDTYNQVFGGSALIGTKRHDSDGDRNMTLEDWMKFAGNVMDARPWYGNGRGSLLDW